MDVVYKFISQKLQFTWLLDLNWFEDLFPYLAFGVTCARRMSSEVAHDMEYRLSSIPSWYFYKRLDWFHSWFTKFKLGLIQAKMLRLSWLQLVHDLSCQLGSLIFTFTLLFDCLFVLSKEVHQTQSSKTGWERNVKNLTEKIWLIFWFVLQSNQTCQISSLCTPKTMC